MRAQLVSAATFRFQKLLDGLVPEQSSNAAGRAAGTLAARVRSLVEPACKRAVAWQAASRTAGQPRSQLCSQLFFLRSQLRSQKLSVHAVLRAGLCGRNELSCLRRRGACFTSAYLVLVCENSRVLPRNPIRSSDWSLLAAWTRVFSDLTEWPTFCTFRTGGVAS